jgi:hypothetical protein
MGMFSTKRTIPMQLRYMRYGGLAKKWLYVKAAMRYVVVAHWSYTMHKIPVDIIWLFDMMIWVHLLLAGNIRSSVMYRCDLVSYYRH